MCDFKKKSRSGCLKSVHRHSRIELVPREPQAVASDFQEPLVTTSHVCFQFCIYTSISHTATMAKCPAEQQRGIKEKIMPFCLPSAEVSGII